MRYLTVGVPGNANFGGGLLMGCWTEDSAKVMRLREPEELWVTLVSAPTTPEPVDALQWIRREVYRKLARIYATDFGLPREIQQMRIARLQELMVEVGL